ncbi:MAG: hypothetical protein IT488_00255 [Gammaproteobacteria bacterium]|nr:hypothetical protein [Gammaproteobacteria bacterium]
MPAERSYHAAGNPVEPITEPIKPETHALDALIQASVQQLLTAGPRNGSTNDGLLFLGNWHDAMPRLIFQDPVLQPVDTRIWGVIKIAASGTRPTAFPTYKQIARTANVGSEATVARSMAILRATRWLSLCLRVRDAQGRYRGNIYALHDEPLPLLDTIYLDQEYMQFLEQALSHGHPHVRRVAAATMEALSEDLRAGHDLVARVNPMHRRLEAIGTLESQETRFFGFSSRQLQNLKSGSEDDPLQYLQSEPLQKLKSPTCSSSSSSSSSYINNKTTTTTTGVGNTTRAHAREGTSAPPLVMPASFTANERRAAMICLGDAPESTRQDILDELAGRMTAARRRGAPIDNPLGYLSGLCRAARKEEFALTSPGLRVQEQREKRSHEPKPTETQSLRDRDNSDGTAISSTRPSGISSDIDRESPGDGSAITLLDDDGADGTAISSPMPCRTAQVTTLASPSDGTAITFRGDQLADGIAISPARNPHAPVHKRNGLEACERALVEMRAIFKIRGPALTAPLPETPISGDGSAITRATGPPILKNPVSRPECDGTAISQGDRCHVAHRDPQTCN